MSNPIVTRGRASKSNTTSRYDAQAREGFDDGWAEDEDEPERLETTLITEKAKSILSRNDSPDIGFDRSINPYRGCEHGCIYCYARPTHAFLGHSPGLDFETKLYFKPEAAKLLEHELEVPGYRPELVQLGANTDPYQPIEKRLLITRQVLKVLLEKLPMAVFDSSFLQRSVLEELCKAAGVKFRLVLQSNHVPTIQHAVANDLGAATLLRSIVQADERIVGLSFRPQLRFRFSLCWRHEKNLTKACRTFIDFARERYRPDNR